METEDASNKNDENSENNAKGLVQRQPEPQQPKQGAKSKEKGDTTVKTLEKIDNENEAKKNVNGDNDNPNEQASASMTAAKAELFELASKTGIPTDWVQDFDSVGNMASIYAYCENGRSEFYSDYGIKGGKEKNLAERLFYALEQYYIESHGSNGV